MCPAVPLDRCRQVHFDQRAYGPIARMAPIRDQYNRPARPWRQRVTRGERMPSVRCG
jgi:hypothetical protein